MNDMNHYLIDVSRKTIELFVRKNEKLSIPDDCPDEYKEKRGVFVTIYKNVKGSLRGCIGFPYPEFPLIEALIEASISSCQDPRFELLDEEELNEIIIEISILTKPKLIDSDPKKYFDYIEIGKDGLIIKNNLGSGLLLPQVPVEYGWNVEEFLENVCIKASLSPDSWKNTDFKLYKFQAEIINE